MKTLIVQQSDLADPQGYPEQSALIKASVGRLEEDLTDIRAAISRTLHALEQYPPHHVRHFDHLETFYSDGNSDFQKSVFIMTKFPNKASRSKDRQLQKVIDTVKSAVQQCGLDPRIASASDYHAMLWDNVELYLLGCCRGIAIVEDKYYPELNPNVAMEWGWMRALGRSVLFLVERDFSHFRADWGGLIKKEFTWRQPENDIPTSVARWIEGQTA